MKKIFKEWRLYKKYIGGKASFLKFYKTVKELERTNNAN